MIILSSSLGLAGENEDFKYVDNLYREKDFKNALPQSEKFLEKYPDSKYQRDMRDKIAKLYFLQKNYKKADEVFKKLFAVEENKSDKEE